MNSNIGLRGRKLRHSRNDKPKMNHKSQIRIATSRSVKHLPEAPIEGVESKTKKQRSRKPNKWTDLKIENFDPIISKYSTIIVFSNQASKKVQTQKRVSNIVRV